MMKVLVPLLLLALGAAAAAQERAASAPGPAAIGDTTRQWLELQRGQTQAGKSHPMSGEVAGVVHQRYLDSFRAQRPGSGSGSASRARESAAGAAEPRNH